jgi:hypothetical protein
MKKKSLKVKIVELAQGELQQMKGGIGSSSQVKGKTCTQTGKLKNQEQTF